jgi:NADH-ubiquinone oxidoreductase chain 3
MTSITFFFIFIPIIAVLFLAINFLFAPHNSYQEKDSAFECGFHSFLGQNRTQFSISFFIFALLFLLFDLEILLVYPYVVSAYVNGIYGLMIMLIFFLALTLGFAFELGKNALKIDSRQMLTLISKQNNITTFVSSSIPMYNKNIYFIPTISVVIYTYIKNITNNVEQFISDIKSPIFKSIFLIFCFIVIHFPIIIFFFLILPLFSVFFSLDSSEFIGNYSLLMEDSGNSSGGNPGGGNPGGGIPEGGNPGGGPNHGSQISSQTWHKDDGDTSRTTGILYEGDKKRPMTNVEKQLWLNEVEGHRLTYGFIRDNDQIRLMTEAEYNGISISKRIEPIKLPDGWAVTRPRNPYFFGLHVNQEFWPEELRRPYNPEDFVRKIG